MELKVLGSVSPYPRLDHNCPGFLVTVKDKKILLDCGNGTLRLLDPSMDLENLNVIITHLHADHYGDLSSLAYMSYIENKLGNLKERVKVYLPNDHNNLEYLYFNSIEHNYWEINYYNEYNSINIDADIKISIKKTLHDILCYAVRIDYCNNSLVYSADTGYQENYFTEFISNTDLFICESSFLKEHNKSDNNHLYSYQAGLYAKEGSVKELMLTHFYPTIDRYLYLEEAKKIFPNTDLAN